VRRGAPFHVVIGLFESHFGAQRDRTAPLMLLGSYRPYLSNNQSNVGETGVADVVQLSSGSRKRKHLAAISEAVQPFGPML
jgi:hypothetical protein